MRSALLHIISKESTYGTNSRVVVGHSVMVEKERSRAGESDDGRANLLFCCGGCTPEDAPGLSTAVAATSDVTGDCGGAPEPLQRICGMGKLLAGTEFYKHSSSTGEFNTSHFLQFRIRLQINKTLSVQAAQTASIASSNHPSPKSSYIFLSQSLLRSFAITLYILKFVEHLLPLVPDSTDEQLRTRLRIWYETVPTRTCHFPRCLERLRPMAPPWPQQARRRIRPRCPLHWSATASGHICARRPLSSVSYLASEA